MSLPSILTDESADVSMPVNSSGQVMNFRIQRQQMSNWCWAAVCCSLRTFYYPDEKITQGDIVATELNLPYCKASPLPPCNQKRELDEILGTYNLLAGLSENPVEADPVRNEIIRHRPVCCQIYYENVGGHFVVIYGFGYADPSNTDSFSLYVADPMDGGSRFLTLQQLKVNYRGGQWVRTYFTKP
jgi:hypothetical protein